MTLQFTDHPGRRERHLQRRHGNPLFGTPPPQVTPAQLEQARRGDAEEIERFMADFRELVQRAAALKPSEDSEVVLGLKERLDRSYEEACGLAGDQGGVKEAIRQLVSLIMKAVWRGAGDDPQAHEELEQEEQARRVHYVLLEYPIVADLLAPESPIGSDDLLPALLNEDAQALNAVLQLFDAEQLAHLEQDGRALLDRLERDGGDVAVLRERLARFHQAVDAAAPPAAGGH